MLNSGAANRGKMLIPLLLGVVVIAAVVGVLVFGKLSSARKPPNPAPESATEALISMEEIVVNLADSKQPHYLKATIVLEVRGAQAQAETEKLMPKIRDAAICVLSTQFYHDLLVPKHRDRLKELIKKRVNTVLSKSKVVSVYFTDFAMQ